MGHSGAKRGAVEAGLLAGPAMTFSALADRKDFTIGYRCTGFQFDLASTLNKALILFVWAGTINMPFMRRLKSVGQATVILLALGPFLPLSFFSEICEAAIERLSKTSFGKGCINASERLALYFGRQELL